MQSTSTCAAPYCHSLNPLYFQKQHQLSYLVLPTVLQAPGLSTTLGEAVLTSRDLFLQRWWTWIGMGVLIGYFIIFLTGQMLSMK